MKCPHCLTSFHEDFETNFLISDTDGSWRTVHAICPECRKVIIYLRKDNSLFLVYPKGISRKPLPLEVTDEKIINDYKEASLVLTDSPKASAALSRRCLQYILEEKGGVKKDNLNKEIQEIINLGNLPTYISDNLDAIRNVGNFSAHSIKSTNTGEIIEVEEGEADWNLEVLEQLIDFYFVQPVRSLSKRVALNTKLKEAGKPPLNT